MAPVLADVRIRGRDRKVVVYGSKSGMFFILDRIDGIGAAGHRRAAGAAGAAAEDLAHPAVPGPGRLDRAARRRPAAGHRGSRATRTGPCRTTCRARCTTRTGTCPILSIPGHGGGGDWSHLSFSHRTGLVYTGFGYVAAAHSLTESSNGLRPPGEYQTGGIVAVDVEHQPGARGRSACRTRWRTATAS